MRISGRFSSATRPVYPPSLADIPAYAWRGLSIMENIMGLMVFQKQSFRIWRVSGAPWALYWRPLCAPFEPDTENSASVCLP